MKVEYNINTLVGKVMHAAVFAKLNKINTITPMFAIGYITRMYVPENTVRPSYTDKQIRDAFNRLGKQKKLRKLTHATWALLDQWELVEE